MRSIALAIGVLWAAFWVGWMGAAFTAKRGRRNGSGFAIRAGIVIVGLVVVNLVRRSARNAGVVENIPQGAIGLALVVCGLAFAVWARVHLGRNWGPPMTVKLSDHQLVTSGPYRYVRNPIYSGIWFALLGTAVALNLLLLVIVAGLGCYFVYSCKVEERIMLSEHPDTYPAYRARTKMLIPFVL